MIFSSLPTACRSYERCPANTDSACSSEKDGAAQLGGRPAASIQSCDVVVQALGEMIIDWWVKPQDGRKVWPYPTRVRALEVAAELAAATGGKVVCK